MEKSIQKVGLSLTLFWSSSLSSLVGRQGVDTTILEVDYPLIRSSNGCAPWIEFVECYVGSSFAFWPICWFGPDPPQFGAHLAHAVAHHVFDQMGAWLPCRAAAPHLHVACLCIPAAPSHVLEKPGRRSSTPSYSPLPLHHSLFAMAMPSAIPNGPSSLPPHSCCSAPPQL
jgi:hypothetical protein